MPRRSSARLRLGTTFGLALAVALACKPDKPVAPDGGAGKGDGGGAGAITDIAPVTRPAEMLPSSTVLVWELAGPDRIAEVIGRDALVQKFQPQYRKIADEITREAGRDLLDPKALADMGIDTKGHIGFAMVSLRPMTVVAFASVRDKGRLRSAVLELARSKGRELVSTPLGHAEI
ncbi:MAG TPA: hypothetical protein VFG69_15975, partial [Nannocystaceae bacterium]|nr:hypothetical protein [Nannocystaceae bacterium]